MTCLQTTHWIEYYFSIEYLTVLNPQVNKYRKISTTVVAKIIASPGKNTVIHSLFTVYEQNWTLYLFFSLSFAL